MRIGRRASELFGPLPAWYSRAACAGVDPYIFDNPLGEGFARAMAVCESCPVTLHCLRTALADQHSTGIWGGTTEKKRRAIRNRARRRARLLQPQPQGEQPR